MVEIHHLRDFLNKITLLSNNRSYTTSCQYADGMGCTIFMIYFTDLAGSRILGKIAFHMESGKICNYSYRGKRFGNANNIVDLLLDIYNFEKDKQQVSI